MEGHLGVRTQAAKQTICFFFMEEGMSPNSHKKHKPARKAFFKTFLAFNLSISVKSSAS